MFIKYQQNENTKVQELLGMFYDIVLNIAFMKHLSKILINSISVCRLIQLNNTTTTRCCRYKPGMWCYRGCSL